MSDITSNLKQKTFKGIVWSTIERLGTQGMSFVLNMLIARQLMPSDYGLIAILLIFMTLCQTFVDSGFAAALIRKIDRTEQDYNTVFYFNVFASLLVYALMWFLIIPIAKFYSQPDLVIVSRVLFINLIIYAFSTIQNIQLSIELKFKERALITTISVALSSILALWMAFNGFGVWTLAAQYLCLAAIKSILLWVMIGWRPRLLFSWSSFKEMFSFGSKLLGTSLVYSIYNNIHTLVIGKFCTPQSLGLYSKAQNLASFPSDGVASVMDSVAYPALATIQNDDEKLVNAYRKFMTLSAFVVFPLMIGLAAVADPFIRFCLTDKWADSILLMQLLCITLMWTPVNSINLNLLKIKGRSDYLLKIVLITRTLGVLTLVITIFWGLKAVCLGQMIHAVVMLPVNSFYSKRLIGYSIINQFADLFPIILNSTIMGIVAYAATLFMISSLSQLLVGIFVGTFCYFFCAVLFKMKELKEIQKLVFSKII